MMPSGPRMKAGERDRNGSHALPDLLGVIDPIGAGSRVMKQRSTLGRRIALREPFEAVEEHVMGERNLVDREVALEHAPVRAKLLDAVAHDRSNRRGQLLRTDRPRPRMQVKA